MSEQLVTKFINNTLVDDLMPSSPADTRRFSFQTIL